MTRRRGGGAGGACALAPILPVAAGRAQPCSAAGAAAGTDRRPAPAPPPPPPPAPRPTGSACAGTAPVGEGRAAAPGRGRGREGEREGGRSAAGGFVWCRRWVTAGSAAGRGGERGGVGWAPPGPARPPHRAGAQLRVARRCGLSAERGGEGGTVRRRNGRSRSRGLPGPNGWRGGAPRPPRPWGPLGAGSPPGLRGVSEPRGAAGPGSPSGAAAWAPLRAGLGAVPPGGSGAAEQRQPGASRPCGAGRRRCSGGRRAEAPWRVPARTDAWSATGGEVRPRRVRSAVQDYDNVSRLLYF